MGGLTPVHGGPLTIAVTGAGGFLGGRIVTGARGRGHHVRAITRGAPLAAWTGDAGIEALRADLAEGGDLAPLLAGADVVIHAAAALSGGEAAMARDTVEATRAVLAAASREGVRRAVLAGSLAVYAAGPPGGVIDEASPLEDRPGGRDVYARAKIAQEGVAREAGLPGLWILRIGALFGPGRLWNAHLGLRLGPLAVRLGSGPIPLAFVEHAARACVLAAETAVTGASVVNVIDDDLPDARRYLAALGPDGPRLAVPLPWRLLDAVAPGLERLPVPGLLRRPTLRARLMPRAWPNAALHERLGWRPLMGFEAAMAFSRGVAR